MWTVVDIMNEFAVSRATVYNWMAKGLPYSKLGRSTRYEPKAVRTWVSSKIETRVNEQEVKEL
jgi:predicted DNA-binding transcriptional regulator AlpA